MRDSQMGMTLCYAHSPKKQKPLRSTITPNTLCLLRHCGYIAGPSIGADDRGQSPELRCYHACCRFERE